MQLRGVLAVELVFYDGAEAGQVGEGRLVAVAALLVVDEPGVVEQLGGRVPFCGVLFEHFQQKVLAGAGVLVLAVVLVKIDVAHLVELERFFLVRGVEGTFLVHQLVENHAQAEYVDLGVVLLLQEDLRRYVPGRPALLADLLLVVDEVGHEEVDDAQIPEVARVPEHDVFQLDVPVVDVFLVHVRQPQQQVPHDVQELLLIKVFLRLNVCLEVSSRYHFRDNEDVRLILVDLQDFLDRDVVQLSEDGQLLHNYLLVLVTQRDLVDNSDGVLLEVDEAVAFVVEDRVEGVGVRLHFRENFVALHEFVQQAVSQELPVPLQKIVLVLREQLALELGVADPHPELIGRLHFLRVLQPLQVHLVDGQVHGVLVLLRVPVIDAVLVAGEEIIGGVGILH